jgi:transcriptional regulator with XRE-family HTH domain
MITRPNKVLTEAAAGAENTEETSVKTVAANVRRLLRTKKIKTIDLARRIGTSRQYIYMIRGGLGNVTLETLDKLAEGLEVKPWQLLLRVKTKIDRTEPPLPPNLKRQYGLEDNEDDESGTDSPLPTAVSQN